MHGCRRFRDRRHRARRTGSQPGPTEAATFLATSSLPALNEICAPQIPPFTGTPTNGSMKISVEGNTDNVGNAQSNMALSLARAQSVVSAVAAGGIDASRMTAVGHGQDNPIADNSTEDGRAQNRRVDLVKK